MEMIRSDIRNELIKVAKKGETITYGKLMHKFGIPPGHPKLGIGIGDVVGAISNYEYQHGRPLLSAIVVYANSETKICPKGNPGGGFFGLDGIPPNLKRNTTIALKTPRLSRVEQEFVRSEQKIVWNYWKIHID